MTVLTLSRGRRAATAWLPLCAGLALLVACRLFAVLSFDVAQTSDMAWYYERALEMLASGRYAEGGIPTAFWPVGYPAFLAGVMALTAPSAMAGQLANVALSLGCGWLIHRFCRERFDDERVALVAVLLYAVYPNQIGYSVGLFSEPLYTLLLLVIIVDLRPGAGALRLALIGVVAGLATLVKAQTLLLAPVLMALLLLPRWSVAGLVAALPKALLASLCMALTIAPWTWRNLRVLGAPVAVSTNGGMSLLAGNNPSVDFSLRTSFNDDDPLFDAVAFSVADQVAADRRARAAAIAQITQDPIRFVALMPKKAFRLWAPDGESEWIFQAGYSGYDAHQLWFRTVRAANQLFYFMLIAGFAYGSIKATRRWHRIDTVVLVTLLFFTALSMVFSGQSRYHAPIMPLIVSYAAWTLVRLSDDRRISR